MKTLMLAFVFVSGSLFAFTGAEQEIDPKDVPAEVKAALAKAFPNAQNPEWEKVEANYEAEFEVDTVEYDVLLSASGDILKHKHGITVAELPAAVKSTIEKNHAGFTIDEAEVVEKDGNQHYQVELEKEKTEATAVLTANGQEQDAKTYWD